MTKPLLLSTPEPRKLGAGEIVDGEAPPLELPPYLPDLPDEVILKMMRDAQVLYRLNFKAPIGDIRWGVKVNI